MLKVKNPDKIFFDSDDEFYEFCVTPKLEVIEERDPSTGETTYYTDFKFTQEYLNALSENKKFVIRDENSQITKRGFVSYRTITKPVENLEQYYDYCKHGNKKFITK